MLALCAIAALASPARAIPDMDPPSVPAEPSPAQAERLRVDLREGGKLEFSGAPPVAAGNAWEGEGPLVLLPPTAHPELDLGPLAPPPWLRLSGTVEGSGAALALVAAHPGLLLDWHGFSGPWQVGVETELAGGIDFAEPLAAGAASAEYGLAVPLRGSYGPVAVQTRLLGLDWEAGEAPHLLLPETARLSYAAPDPLAWLGLGDALTLHTEASALLGAAEEEDDPLSVRGRLTWSPWADEPAAWVRPSAGLGVETFEDTWRAGLSLRAEFDLDRDLVPGRHLHLVLEYLNEDLLPGLYGGEWLGGNQLAGVRLGF